MPLPTRIHALTLRCSLRALAPLLPAALPTALPTRLQQFAFSTAPRRLRPPHAPTGESALPVAPSPAAASPSSSSSSSPRTCFYDIRLHRYPPPFLLPLNEEAFQGPSDVLKLQPPANKPSIAPGSILLQQRAPPAASKQQQSDASGHKQDDDASLREESSRWALDRDLNTHMLLTVVRYERAMDAASDAVPSSSVGHAVLCAADSVHTLTSTLHSLLAPHSRTPPLLLVDPTPWLSANRLRMLLGLPPARCKESRLSPAQSDAPLAALFKAGPPYLQIQLASDFRAAPSGEISPAGSSPASSSSTLLLPLNGGHRVLRGEPTFWSSNRALTWILLLALLGMASTIIGGAAATVASNKQTQQRPGALQEDKPSQSKNHHRVTVSGAMRAGQEAEEEALPLSGAHPDDQRKALVRAQLEARVRAKQARQLAEAEAEAKRRQ